MLVKDTGETVDESAELLSAENAVALIKAWASIISRPTTGAVDLPCCCAEIESAGVVNPDCPRHGAMRANH